MTKFIASLTTSDNIDFTVTRGLGVGQTIIGSCVANIKRIS